MVKGFTLYAWKSTTKDTKGTKEEKKGIKARRREEKPIKTFLLFSSVFLFLLLFPFVFFVSFVVYFQADKSRISGR